MSCYAGSMDHVAEPRVGEEHVLKRLLEIYAGIPYADMVDLPVELSLRMGGALAKKNQRLVHEWLYVAMRQGAIRGNIAGDGLRSLFEAFCEERLHDPATAAFYAELTESIRAHHGALLGGAEINKDLNDAINDLWLFDRVQFTEPMLWRLHCMTKPLLINEYLLAFGTMAQVSEADQMRAYGRLEIDLNPLFDDMAWLTQRMLTATTFTQLKPERLGQLRGYASQERHFALDLDWQR
jgi:hypothetical protein